MIQIAWHAWLPAALATIAIAGEAPVKKPLPAAKDGLHGQLSEFGGLRVLELWGDADQAGYAHGFLLADDIVRLFDEYLLNPRIIGNTFAWEGVVLPAVGRLFDWPEDARRELSAVYRGMRDALGEDGLFSERIDRGLTLEDLLAANAYPDMNGFMCSTISVWGDLTADGETLTGRNLDFPYTSYMAGAQIVLIRHPSAKRPGTAGVTWPGAIGVFTAMNDRGITMLIHDANGHRPTDQSGFTPRALILREALESARPETYLEDVRRVLSSRRVLIGNNVHVSAPRAPLGKNAAPAVVFEYDGGSAEGGVTIRWAEPKLSPDSLWCTNHMRERHDPVACERYEGLWNAVYRYEQATPIGVGQLFDMMHDVRQNTTLHTVVLCPASREMHVRIPSISGNARVKFDLDKWFSDKTTAVGSR